MTKRLMKQLPPHDLIVCLGFIVVLTLGFGRQALALPPMDAADFFGDCSSTITVSQDTRVTGTFYMPEENCEVEVDPGFTLEFAKLLFTAAALKVTSGAGSEVLVTHSTIEATSGLLDFSSQVSLNAPITVTDSSLTTKQGFFRLISGATSPITVTHSRLTGARFIDFISDANSPISVTDSSLTAGKDIVLETQGDLAPITVTDSSLTSGDFVTLATSGDGATIAVSDSRLTTLATEIQLFAGEENSTVWVSNSTLTAAEIIDILSTLSTYVTESSLMAQFVRISSFGATEATGNNFTGDVMISGSTGCIAKDNNPDVQCS